MKCTNNSKTRRNARLKLGEVKKAEGKAGNAYWSL